MASEVIGLIRAVLGDRALDTYLNDHLAGATFGADLSRRIADRAEDPELRVVAEEIAQDRRTLVEVMDRLDVSRSSVKSAATWAAEQLARLKLSGLTAGDSAFGHYLELEALSLGVAGKAAMWSALGRLGDSRPELGSFDFAELGARADRQREVIERLRLEHAAAGLAR